MNCLKLTVALALVVVLVVAFTSEASSWKLIVDLSLFRLDGETFCVSGVSLPLIICAGGFAI